MLLMLENIIYSKGRFALWQFGTWIHLGHFSPRPMSMKVCDGMLSMLHTSTACFSNTERSCARSGIAICFSCVFSHLFVSFMAQKAPLTN